MVVTALLMIIVVDVVCLSCFVVLFEYLSSSFCVLFATSALTLAYIFILDCQTELSAVKVICWCCHSGDGVSSSCRWQTFTYISSPISL